MTKQEAIAAICEKLFGWERKTDEGDGEDYWVKDNSNLLPFVWFPDPGTWEFAGRCIEAWAEKGYCTMLEVQGSDGPQRASFWLGDGPGSCEGDWWAREFGPAAVFAATCAALGLEVEE